MAADIPGWLQRLPLAPGTLPPEVLVLEASRGRRSTGMPASEAWDAELKGLRCDRLCPPLRGAGHCDSSGGVSPRLQRPHMTNVSPGIRVQPLPNLLRLVPHLTLPRELWPGCLPALGASETHAMTESSTLHARPGGQALGLPPPRRPGSRPSPGVHGPSAPRAPAGVSGGRPPR